MEQLQPDKYRLADIDNGILFSSSYHESTVTKNGDYCSLVIVCLEDGETYEVDNLPLPVAKQVIADLIRQSNSGIPDQRYVSRLTKWVSK